MSFSWDRRGESDLSKVSPLGLLRVSRQCESYGLYGLSSGFLDFSSASNFTIMSFWKFLGGIRPDPQWHIAGMHSLLLEDMPFSNFQATTVVSGFRA